MPQRTETIRIESLTEFEYKEKTYLAGVFSDGKVHVLSFGGNGAVVENGEVSISVPDYCGGVIDFDNNWDDIPEDSIDAQITYSSCAIEDQDIAIDMIISVGDEMFKRQQEGYTKGNVEAISYDSFEKV